MLNLGNPARILMQKSILAVMNELTRRVATATVRERLINLIRRSWYKHKRTRRLTLSVMDKLSSKYTPRFATDDDAFTEPSRRTNADL